MSTNRCVARGVENRRQMRSKEQIVRTNRGLKVRAPAKINLSLLVAGKRVDGFHEIESVMAKVDFYDEILIEPGLKAGIEMVCQGPEWAPAGQENLIYKAAELFMNSCGVRADIRITLTKNVPAGSGLGSASSDAAATLIGLTEYLELELSKRSLGKLAVKLGSDVAFFLGGPLSFCTGRGEKIKKIRKKFNFSALLILPNISVSTEKVYGNYRHNQGQFEELSNRIKGHIVKNRIDLVCEMCANMLETSSFGLYEGLAELKTKVESLGMCPCCLSGSGAGMFYILDSKDEESVSANQDKLEDEMECKSFIVRNNRW